MTASREVQRDVRVRVDRVAQRRLQPAVELDDVDVRGALGEVLGEHAEAAADLEHDVVAAELGGARDHVEQVRVDQEVLAELAVRADPERLMRRRLGCAGRSLTSRTAGRRWPPRPPRAPRRRCPRRSATKRAVWTT